MPKCRDGKFCIDDLCHFTERTLCGLWTIEEFDDEDDYLDDDLAYEGSEHPEFDS